MFILHPRENNQSFKEFIIIHVQISLFFFLFTQLGIGLQFIVLLVVFVFLKMNDARTLDYNSILQRLQ